MARADLIIRMIKSFSCNDTIGFQKTAEEMIAEEKRKGHVPMAQRMHKALRPAHVNGNQQVIPAAKSSSELFYELTPERPLSHLLLPDIVERQIKQIIEEQHRAELLHSHNLRARHRLLFAGPPGNGKTALAEAIAYELMYPLLVIRYESLIGSYLGETSGRIKNVLEYAKTTRCVLFFDEFETLGKERGDTRETGEIKRIVSSLLLQTDALPDYVVFIAASNHPELLDRAVWRRFQIKAELPLPNRSQLCTLIDSIAKRCETDFGHSSETLAKHLIGYSYAEAEQFCLDIVRRIVLSGQSTSAKEITKDKLKQSKAQLQPDKTNN